MKPNKKKCATPCCRNKVTYGRTCSTCRSKKCRDKDPKRYSYNNLVNNANHRGIFIDLTFEEFCLFCYKTDYMHRKGRGKENYSIDRKIAGKYPGYTLSNIRVLTVSNNSKKRWKEYDYLTGNVYIRNEAYVDDSGENPF